MSKAYIKGTIKKVFDLKSGEGKRGPWTRLDVVVTKEAGSVELDAEPILKIWGGDQLQVYEGATVEAHGKLDEYGGQVRIVADAKDVTINGGAAPTPEQAKVIMTSASPKFTLSQFVEFVAELHPKFQELSGDPGAAKSYVITAWLGITKGPRPTYLERGRYDDKERYRENKRGNIRKKT
jgi:hypothetical protein